MTSYKTVEQHFTNVIQSQSADSQSLALAFNNRGHAKYMQVDFDEAVEDYSEAVKLDPNLAVAYYNRGTVRYRLGYYEDAVNDMKKAVALDPNNTEFNEALEACQKISRTKS